MQHEKKFYKVTEIARIYGIKIETVRNLCHARGQKFATRLVPNGRFYIDIEKFDEFLKRKQERTG